MDSQAQPGSGPEGRPDRAAEERQWARRAGMTPDPLQGTPITQVCMLVLLSLLVVYWCAWRKARAFNRQCKAHTAPTQPAPVGAATAAAAAAAGAVVAPPARVARSAAAPDHGFFRPARVTLEFEGLSYWSAMPGGLRRSLRRQIATRVPPLRRLYKLPEAASVVPPRQILRDVWGSFESGGVTAIMGPSGSGKTSLLNLLSGRTESGTFAGRRTINGRELPPEIFEREMRTQGYVLQEDAFFEELGVRESLCLSAGLLMPHAVSLTERLQCVDQLLGEVGLTEVADVRIGGVGRKGISGGQKRRLSVATELLGQPGLLFLDEPTSGLDSGTGLRLVQLLSSIARLRQRTVVLTIHQPGGEIFKCFESLLLLAAGGRVGYFGRADAALRFMEQAGVPAFAANSASPGEYLIDAVDSSAVVDFFHGSEAAAALRSRPSGQTANGGPHTDATSSSRGLTSGRASAWPTSLWQQTWVLLARRLAVQRASAWATVSELAQVAAVSVILCVAFSYNQQDQTYLKPYRDTEWLFCAISYLMIMQYMITVPLYDAERPMLNKEREGGVVRLEAYQLSTLLSDTSRALMHTLTVLVFAAPLQQLNRGRLLYIAAIAFLGTCSFQSVIAAVSHATDDAGTVYTVLFLLLGGGSLFGGLMVSCKNVHPLLQPCLYTPLALASRSAVLLNTVRNPNYLLSCPTLLTQLSGVVSSVDQLQPLVQGLLNGTACSQLEEALPPPRWPDGQTPPGFDSTSNSTIDVGTIALATYQFRDAFIQTNALLLAVYLVSFRLIALAVARLRVRLAKKLRFNRAASIDLTLGEELEAAEDGQGGVDDRDAGRGESRGRSAVGRGPRLVVASIASSTRPRQQEARQGLLLSAARARPSHPPDAGIELPELV